jgi:Fe2+ or Zn2+ uptake regulation protein
LELLAQIGLVRRIHSDEGCHRFASASRGHHHHLVCRYCGATVEFEGCDLPPFFARLSQETGYLIEDHLLELLGICAACQQQA